MLYRSAHAPTGGTAHARFLAGPHAALRAFAHARRTTPPSVPADGAGPSVLRGCETGESVAHRREQHDLADGVGSRQQHHEAVDAETDPAGGRHPLLERFHEELVVGL